MLITRFKKKILFLIVVGNIVLLPLTMEGGIAFAEEVNREYEESAQEELYFGIQYLRSKKYDEAIEQLKKVIETYSKSGILAEAWSYLAKAYKKQRLYSLAIEACEKVLELQPQKLSFYLVLLELYEKVDDRIKMNKVAEQIAQLYVPPNMKIPERLRSLKLYGPARKCYQKLIDSGRYFYRPHKNMLWAFPLFGTRLFGSIFPNIDPLVADLDGDDELEIVGFSDQVLCLNGKDGSILWRCPIKTMIGCNPILVDIDGDKLLDIVAVTGDVVWAWRGYDGKLLWKNGKGEVETDTSLVSGLSTGNFNKDSINDIVADLTRKTKHGSLRRDAYCLNGKNGDILWKNHDINVYQSLILDADNDGIDDIVEINDIDKEAIVYNGLNGKLARSLKAPGGCPEPQRYTNAATYDLNNDGVKEIIAATGEGEIWAMDLNGKKLWKSRIYSKTSGGYYYSDRVSIVRINNNPTIKIKLDSFVDSGSTFVIDGITGKVESALLKEAKVDIISGYEQKKAVDINNDGKLEMVAQSGPFLYVYSVEEGKKKGGGR